MTLNRRALLSGLAAGITLPAFRADTLRIVAQASRTAGSRTAPDIAADEAYWSQIQTAFDADRTLVNLNNGGCSPTPLTVPRRWAPTWASPMRLRSLTW